MTLQPFLDWVFYGTFIVNVVACGFALWHLRQSRKTLAQCDALRLAWHHLFAQACQIPDWPHVVVRVALATHMKETLEELRQEKDSQ